MGRFRDGGKVMSDPFAVSKAIYWWEPSYPEWDEIEHKLGPDWGPQVRKRCDIAEYLMDAADLPRPASLIRYSDDEVFNNFVLSNSPLPDLEAAEYVRRLLQQTLGRWTCDTISAGLRLAMAPEDTKWRMANKQRAIIQMFARGDYSKPAAIARRVNSALEADDLALAKKYELSHNAKTGKPLRSSDRIAKLKDMTKKLRAVGGAVRLEPADFEEITHDFSAEFGSGRYHVPL